MRLVRGALALLLAGLAAPLAAEDRADEPTLRVEVSHSGEDWRATFTFTEGAKDWAFVRSNRARELDAS